MFIFSNYAESNFTPVPITITFVYSCHLIFIFFAFFQEILKCKMAGKKAFVLPFY